MVTIVYRGTPVEIVTHNGLVMREGSDNDYDLDENGVPAFTFPLKYGDVVRRLSITFSIDQSWVARWDRPTRVYVEAEQGPGTWKEDPEARLILVEEEQKEGYIRTRFRTHDSIILSRNCPMTKLYELIHGPKWTSTVVYAFSKAGIESFYDLDGRKWGDLLSIPGMGPKRLTYLQEQMRPYLVEAKR